MLDDLLAEEERPRTLFEEDRQKPAIANTGWSVTPNHISPLIGFLPSPRSVGSRAYSQNSLSGIRHRFFQEFCEYDLRSENYGQQAANCTSESLNGLKFGQPKEC